MDTQKKPLIILTGPTAVGKTELSIRLAREINAEIISADSMQVYKYMDIGSAKIMPDEMQGIKHHLVDALEPTDEFNIVTFKTMAEEAMQSIYDIDKIPLMVGGTGFYIQSIIKNIDFSDTTGELSEIRTELEAIAKENGAHYLHEMLKEIDPKSYETIHENDLKRVIRAIEFYRESGKRISDHNLTQADNESPYNFVYFVLNDIRENIYERINLRVEKMIDLGLVDEVKKLRAMGLKRENVSMQGLGYKEIFDYLDGRIDLDEAKYIIKRDTRHFAKRQLTWFKRESNVTWVNKNEFDYDDDEIMIFIKEKLKVEGII